MILVAATLAAFAFTDLLRGNAKLPTVRTIGAVVVAIALACGLSRLAGLTWSTVAIIAGAQALVLVNWVVLEARAATPRSAAAALVWVTGALFGALAASGAVPAISGPLDQWFSNLDVHDSKAAGAPDRFVVACAAGLFLLATANRLVRLVLAVAQTPTQRAETTLRGGRLIGPMERLFIGAMVVAGEPAGVAIVIAAKGLLRLPEIQRTESTAVVDEMTEYFLIGTFTSMLIAIAAGGAVLAAG